MTNKKYLNTVDGSIYGLSHTPFRYSTEGWNLLDINGPVDNLTFAGQDMLSVGIASAITSGMMTAWRSMGYLQFTEFLKGINVKRDFENFELFK